MSPSGFLLFLTSRVEAVVMRTFFTFAGAPSRPDSVSSMPSFTLSRSFREVSLFGAVAVSVETDFVAVAALLVGALFTGNCSSRARGRLNSTATRTQPELS